MPTFSNQTVLITGSAKGIGRCIAIEFAKAGARVILTDVSESALETTRRELTDLGCDVHVRVVNVADKNQVMELAEWVRDRFGGLDVLINNAGIGHQGELAETTLDTWKQLVDVNFWGPLNHVYAFLPQMEERGRSHIVNVSSGQAWLRLPTWGPYSVTKLAVGAFSELLAIELAPRRIRVTTVYPYMVHTGFYDNVEGETFMARMSMKLLPLYSLKPETVGRQIFNAVRRNRRVERTHVLNLVFMAMRAIPPLADLVSVVALHALADTKKTHGPAKMAKTA